MDSRKILEIYKLINDRSPILVSNWQSIDDIPVGMRVLDNDGIVKQCRYVFHNQGTDYINLGRPEYLSKLRPGADSFSVLVTCARNEGTSMTMVSWGAGIDVTHRQFQLICATSKRATVNCGGIETTLGTTTAPLGTFVSYLATVSGTVVSLSSGGNSSSGVAGTYVGGENLYIGGRTNGALVNFEGDISYIEIYDGNKTIIDAFDPNRNDLWDGGATGYTVMGYPFTVTDGTPVGCRAKALVPVSML